MCGLAAILNPESKDDASARIDAALRKMRRRGPDGSKIHLDPKGRAAIGHSRLAVVSVDDGEQPIESEDSGLVCAVNGEFYGWRDIRVGLEARGHRFRTRSDSEILLHLWEEEGAACYTKLRGEFAFLLWDARNGVLHAARDRFGVKPLVWTDLG